MEDTQAVGSSNREAFAVKEPGTLEALSEWVFHFQTTYYDARFMELIDKGKNVAVWVRSLNSEFGRWLLAQLTNTK